MTNPDFDNAEPLIGKRYRLLERIGAGGMGIVFRAEDRLTGHIVALKRVTFSAVSQEAPVNLNETALRLALSREFETAARLRHPHIINVLDYGYDAQRQPYIVMDLLEDARDLAHAARGLDHTAKLNLLIGILQALVYLHRRSLLHRDLKPSNVLVDKHGNLKLLDFGLAIPVGTETLLAGTVAYIAPELLRGESASIASDLYAVGVIAYELFAGKAPFEADTPKALMQQILTQVPDLSLLPNLTPADLLSTVSDAISDHRATATIHVAAAVPPAGSTAVDITDSTLTAMLDQATSLDPQSVTQLETRSETLAAVDANHDTLLSVDQSDSGLSATIAQDDRTLQHEVPVHDKTAHDKTVRMDPLRTAPPTESVTPPSATLAPTTSPRQQPPTLRDIVGRLLSKQPQQRYPDATSILSALYSSKDKTVITEAPTLRESFLQGAQFVGRESELGTLLGALEAARAGNGGAWLVAGESGVGKSRFLDELRIHALVSGMLVLRGQGVEGGGYPYQLWRDAVRRMVLNVPINAFEASILKEVVPDLARLLGREVGDPPELPSKAAQERLGATIVDLFMAHDQPILLLLEDLQWTHESLFVLKLLLNVVRRSPLLIVGSYRDDEVPDLPNQLFGAQVLKLERLADQAVATLCTAMLGDAGRNPELLRLIQTETEGNTFFIVELMRALAEEAGSLSRIGKGKLSTGVITENVKQLLQRRLNRVPEWGRALLQLAAVAGNHLDLTVLRHLAVHPVAADQPQPVMENSLEDWLSTCANAAVLDISDNKWRFAHDKLRQAALQALTADARAHHHRQVAESIEAVYPDDVLQADTLMQHWKLAGDTAKELHYLMLVTQRTLKTTGDYLQVITLGEHGLTLLPADDPRRLRLHNWVGEAQMRRGQYPAARDSLNHITSADPMPNPEIVAQALQTLGWVDCYTANFESAHNSFKRSIDLASTLNELALVANGYNGLGATALYQGNFDASRDYFSQVFIVARNARLPRIIASALSGLGNVEARVGNFVAVRKYFTETLDYIRDTGDRWALCGALTNLGALLMNSGDHEAGEPYITEALVIARLLGDGRQMAINLSNLAAVAILVGDYQTAIDYFTEALSYRRAIGDKVGMIFGLRNIGSALMEQGKISEAVNYLQQSIELGREISDKHGLSWGLFSIAQTDIQQGNFDAARRHLHEGLSIGWAIKAGPVIVQCLLTAAQLNLATGTPEQAARYIGVAQAHESYMSGDQRDFDKLRPRFDAVMNAATFDNLVAEGKQLPLDQVIDKLLIDLAPPDSAPTTTTSA